MSLDYSVILQNPAFLNVVNQGLLERAFHDALFPAMLYRAEYEKYEWPLHAATSLVFNRSGTIAPIGKPRRPGSEITPKTYEIEQWEVQLQEWADGIDTHMPTASNAIINLFMRDIQQMGMQAAQSMNRRARNTLFNAATAGQTVTSASGTGTTSVPVKNLNGFTTARPSTGGRFQPVSASNPLAVRIFNTAGATEQSVNVIGFVADTDLEGDPGDEFGPGTLTVSASVTFSARDYVLAEDRTYMIRCGGGDKIDAITTGDVMEMAHIREATTRFWSQNIPTHGDGRFHCHISPLVQNSLFADNELQRLTQSLPEYYIYKDFMIGEILNTVFFLNNENPAYGASVRTSLSSTTILYDSQDNFGAELTNNGLTTGNPVSYSLFTGYDGAREYSQDPQQYLTDVGMNGKIAEPQITNNGISIPVDRVKLYIRTPLDRLGDTVSSTWRFVGNWVTTTDSLSGDSARYKRQLAVVSSIA